MKEIAERNLNLAIYTFNFQLYNCVVKHSVSNNRCESFQFRNEF